MPPDTLEQLTEEDRHGKVWCLRDEIKDPWGNDFELRSDERGYLSVVSYGSNGEPDSFTTDRGLDMDISSRLPLGGE